MIISGSIDGLKNSMISALEALYEMEIPQDRLWTEELVNTLADLSGAMNREIAIYSDRKGRITDVCVGDFKTVDLNEVEGRRSKTRLAGVRCIHTHPNGSGMLSPVDVSSLRLLRLDMMAAIGVADQKPTDLYVAVPSPVSMEDVEYFGPYSPDKEDFSALLEYIGEADDFLRSQAESLEKSIERAILVGIKTQETRDIQGVSEADISMIELKELAQTAGALTIHQVMQKREGRDAAYFIGKGKVEELRLLAQTLEADLIVFDEEISPSQQRNLQEAIGVKVIDRTGLILDIFAQRARSREGKIQVELAQLQYHLPRIGGQGIVLSRLGGGIGTRGPGETKLETDKRHIRRKINALKEQLQEIKKQRNILRIERRKNRVPVVSLVGYTNAGKSSLLNTLCGSNVYAENKLFATLDTTTRQLLVEDNAIILMTDTVGFIRKLPHHLMDAFKSTLEEAVYSDALVIVADSSDPYVEDHIRIVDSILSELGAAQKPTLIACNKIDKPVEGERAKVISDRKVIEISAKTGQGLDELKWTLKTMLFESRRQVQLKIPFSEGWVLPWLYSNGKVLEVDYDESSSLVEAELDNEACQKVKEFILSEEP